MVSDKSAQEISQLLSEFIRIIKIVSVYPEGNPLPTKLKESFCDRFADLIRDWGTITLRIQRDEVLYKGERVYNDRNSEDKLAGLFYKAGIKELTFTREFDFNEGTLLFRVMKAYMNREAGSSDLVALLWEANIAGFGYTTLEDVMLSEYDEGMVESIRSQGDSFVREVEEGTKGGGFSYTDLFDQSAVELHDDTGEVVLSREDLLAEQKMGLAPAPPRGPRLPEVDTARIVREAFKLDKDDLARMEEIVRADTEFNMYEAAGYLMSEILWQQKDFPDFNETATVVEKLQTEFIRAGKLKQAAELLVTLKDLSVHLKDKRPKWVERINQAVAVAGGRERLSHLAQALNEDISISPSELGSYLSVFGWESILVITDLLGDLEHQHHREAVCDFLAAHGKEHIDLISRGVYDKRWYVARNAASVLARIGGSRSFAHLEKVLNHNEPRVRQEVVHRLAKKNDSDSMNFLAQMIWDREETVSREAIEALLVFESNDKFDAITGIIDDDRFATLKEEFQEAFIAAFSRLGGKSAVEYLVKLSSCGSIFTTQAQEFCQRAAFRALGVNSSEEARRALEKTAKSWKKKPRAMAQEALAEWHKNNRGKHE